MDYFWITSSTIEFRTHYFKRKVLLASFITIAHIIWDIWYSSRLTCTERASMLFGEPICCTTWASSISWIMTFGISIFIYVKKGYQGQSSLDYKPIWCFLLFSELYLFPYMYLYSLPSRTYQVPVVLSEVEDYFRKVNGLNHVYFLVASRDCLYSKISQYFLLWRDDAWACPY